MQHFEEEWTRFPDFEKVFPVPDSIKAVGGSVSGNIETAVKKKYRAPLSEVPVIAMLESMNMAKVEIKPEEQEQFERACKAYEETGYAYWYDWNNAHWGTKWNAYSCKKVSDNEYEFDTAWSTVPEIIAQIAQAFSCVKIIHTYADEDTGSNTGRYIYENGIGYSYIPKSGSKEAYEMAFEVNSDSRKYYKLVGDKYEYFDEEDDENTDN